MRVFSVALCFVVSVLSAGAVDFARDIQPLFAEHCLECHGPDKAKGGLLLVTRESAVKTLKSGARAVVPGDVTHSALVERVTTTDAEEMMPPKGKKPLKPDEVERLKTWIKEGAKFDLHWAYKPVLEAVEGLSIDGLVRAKLKEKGILPSLEADALTLLKRASYDLIGLPPTPEQADAFLAEIAKVNAGISSPTSGVPDSVWSNWLTKLMQSPHFGERWGRHWLDAARYADSDGYEKDRPRPDAWRYRDWVIKAINDDLPFDQFTTEQLAGDLLPNATHEQLLATAFNRQTLTNTEGGTDQEQFRVEAVFDRTETLGAVWLGLTVGCARCHTHKYDQISHHEYYQLFAFFNNGDEVTRQVPESPEKWTAYEKQTGAAGAALAKLQKAVDEATATLPAKLPEWEKAIEARLTEARAAKAKQTFAPMTINKVESVAKTKFKKLEDGSWLTLGKAPKTDTFTVTIAPSNKPVAALRLEVLPDESLPGKGPGRSTNGNFVLSKFIVQSDGVNVPLHTATADFEQKEFKAALVLNGSEEKGWAVGGAAGKAHQLTVQFASPVKAGKALTVKLVQNYTVNPLHTIGRFRLLAASEVTEESIVPAAVAKILAEEPKRRNSVVIQPLWDFLAQVDPDVVAATATLQQAKAKLPKPPLMDVRVIAQRASALRETHVLHRGDFLSPADAVQPTVLATLPKLAADKPTRLDLAKWLVSAANPLTPRVTANQMWGRLFGEGLVKTSADFGVRGSAPSHPVLLDFLARKLIDLRWSRKQLLHLIMMSATYRQSSSQAAATEKVLELDPKNELLWRQNRLRVEGEIVRDLHLAASGLLSPKVGGPSVFPPMPADIAELSYAGNFKWVTSPGEDAHRRGLYTFFKRTAPYPDLTTFDCPDANLTNIKRTVSNTPLQALTTLNAEAFAQAARAMSQRLLTESLKSDEERLTRCVRLCLVRQPSEREMTSLKQLLADSRAFYQRKPEEAKTMTGSYEVKGVPVAESAAWSATARIVLNLDEMITRE